MPKRAVNLYWRLVTRFNLSEDQQSTLWALVIGLAAGFAAAVFRVLIEDMGLLCFRDLPLWLGFPAPTAWGWQALLPLIPMLGGLVVGPMVYNWATEARGHGVPEVMFALSREGGRIRPRVGLVKALASAFTLGTGGSAGQEGPIVQIGSALGSGVGQGLRMPARKVKTFVACGAAAGISAVFNAPITGVFFAIEVLLGELRPRSFAFIVVSSATAWMVVTWLLGDAPLIQIPNWQMQHGWELLLCMLLGVLAAGVARFFVVSLYWWEDRFTRLRIKSILKPALGGLGLGIIGIAFPHVFGPGFTVMNAAVHGTTYDRLGTIVSEDFDPNSPHFLLPVVSDESSALALDGREDHSAVFIAMIVLLLLTVAKIQATSLTLSSGGSGGVFTPSLVIGSTLGAAFGLGMQLILPGQTAPAGAYAVIAMAATFAASAHAPVTGILMLYELSLHHGLMPGIMVATVVATLLSYRLSADSIYTVKFKRLGWRIGDSQARDPLQQIQVRVAMATEFFSLPPTMTPRQALLYAETVGQRAYPVVAENSSELQGLITIYDLNIAIASRHSEDVPISELMDPSPSVLTPDDHLDRAVRLLDESDAQMLPVVGSRGERRLIGVLTHATLIRAYNEYQMERE
jgi:CIC family chloride channel protein